MYTTQPVVRVGNILGTVLTIVATLNDDGSDTGVHHYGPDQIARDFTITPDIVYEGETDKTFRVSFTAKGPMYSILPDADWRWRISSINRYNHSKDSKQNRDRNSNVSSNQLSLVMQNINVIARGRVLPSGNLRVGAT